jgi:hypothetical protein
VPKGTGGPSKTPKGTEEAPKGSMAGMEGMKRRDEFVQLDDCAAEDKHIANKSKQSGHLAYNEDGYYVTRAACWIVSEFKKKSGAAA